MGLFTRHVICGAVLEERRNSTAGSSSKQQHSISAAAKE
jgi:hypothetical protein